MFLSVPLLRNIYLLFIKLLFKSLFKYVKKGYVNFPEMEIVLLNKHLLTFTHILKNYSLTKIEYLNDIVAMDYFHQKINRFNVKYVLSSLNFNFKITLSVFLKEYQAINSLFTTFKSSNWLEREVWDLFGIRFWKHPDLRRILTDYGFKGFPLRKDFPLVGFYEMQYDSLFMKVSFFPIKGQQSGSFISKNEKKIWKK